MDVNQVTFFKVAAYFCNFFVSSNMFLLSMSASLAISLEFLLLVFNETSPRKERRSCICRCVNDVRTAKICRFTSIAPLFARSNRLSARTDWSLSSSRNKSTCPPCRKVYLAFWQILSGSVDAVMDDLNVLKIFVLDRQYWESIVFGASLYLGSMGLGNLDVL